MSFTSIHKLIECKNRLMILGHRGSIKINQYPENTLPAFREAIDLGADGIELDIRLTSDNQLVVYHDRDLSRFFGIHSKICNMKSTELKKLKFSQRKFSQIIRIPLLHQVFEEFGTQILYNLEIKRKFGSYKSLIYKLNELIEIFNLQHNIWLSSFDLFFLWQYAFSGCNIYTGLLFEKWNMFTKLLCKCNFVNFLHPNIRLLPFLGEMKNINKPILFWTVNDREELKILQENDILGVITDNVQLLKKWLTTKKHMLH